MKGKSEKGSKVRQLESQIIKLSLLVEWEKKKKTFNLKMEYKEQTEPKWNEMKHFQVIIITKRNCIICPKSICKKIAVVIAVTRSFHTFRGFIIYLLSLCAQCSVLCVVLYIWFCMGPMKNTSMVWFIARNYHRNALDFSPSFFPFVFLSLNFFTI